MRRKAINPKSEIIHYEPRWFKAWPSGVRDAFIAPDGNAYPVGGLHFDVGGVR
jgi:NAD+ synthase (glutamine-hydrolysing)